MLAKPAFWVKGRYIELRYFQPSLKWIYCGDETIHLKSFTTHDSKITDDIGEHVSKKGSWDLNANPRYLTLSFISVLRSIFLKSSLGLFYAPVLYRARGKSIYVRQRDNTCQPVITLRFPPIRPGKYLRIPFLFAVNMVARWKREWHREETTMVSTGISLSYVFPFQVSRYHSRNTNQTFI